MKAADKRRLFQQLGRAGGLERAARMTKQQRHDSAKKAANARWSRVSVAAIPTDGNGSK